MHIDNHRQLLAELPAYIQYKTQKLLRKNQPTKALFHFATQHLFLPLADKSLQLKEKKIAICGQVHTDGVGDYYHILHTAEQIKKIFPTVHITIIPQFNHLQLPAALKVPDPSQFDTLLSLYDEIPQNYLDKIRTADLMLDVSSKSHFDKPKNHLFISEYCDHHFAMGVAEEGLGIGVKDKPTYQSLDRLSHSPLKSLLFDSQNDTQAPQRNYTQHHDLYSSYLKRGSYHQMAFLYTVAALSKESPKPYLDVCIPDLDFSILDMEGLKKFGIGKILSVKWANGQQIEIETVLSSKGKTLRLINPYPLTQEDFYLLMLNSLPPFGCTGDNSISETLSFDLFPFYEIMGVKGSFWDSMIRLAADVGAPHHYLQQYFKELLDIIPFKGLTNVNRLRMFYDTLPRKIPRYQQTIQNSWMELTKQMEGLKIEDTQRNETQKILEKARDNALKFAKDPVNVYLEGKKSQHSILDKLNDLRDRFQEMFMQEISEETQDTLSDFINKAEDYFHYIINIFETPDDAGIWEFKDTQPYLVEAGERIAKLLQTPELQQELSEFILLLKTQYNYNPLLKDLIGRQLALPDYPELAGYEAGLLEKFERREIDIDTAYHLLKEKVDALLNTNSKSKV